MNQTLAITLLALMTCFAGSAQANDSGIWIDEYDLVDYTPSFYRVTTPLGPTYTTGRQYLVRESNGNWVQFGHIPLWSHYYPEPATLPVKVFSEEYRWDFGDGNYFVWLRDLNDNLEYFLVVYPTGDIDLPQGYNLYLGNTKRDFELVAAGEDS